MPKAVLFDVDGTLVTFKFDVEGTRKAMLSELAGRGLDISGLSLTSPTQQIIDSARLQTAGENSGVNFEELRRKLHAILDDFEAESSRKASVFPDARETLLSLRAKSVRLAVLTNSGRRAAQAVLEKGGLQDCFEFVLTREDVDTMKPSPEGILLALSRLALPKEDVCYVGDGVFDIMAAKKAGLHVVSVATGIYTPERLKAEGADQVISSLRELPLVLNV